MKRILIIAAALATLVSCESLKEEFQPVFLTGRYENPSKDAPVSSDKFEKITTIADLAKMYKTEKPWTIDQNIVISGIVSTTDKPGNFYKSFYIQDETGGMEIKIGKNGLYNDYLPGQRIYVDCRDLCLGMYGYKSGNYGGSGMIQIGFTDPSGEYETSYLENSLLIDSHVFKGEIGEEVTPVVLDAKDFPATDATQATNPYIGKLVTIENLKYGWYDSSYQENQTAFVLLYLDSNKDKKASSNRIFISGDNCGSTITTWAMSKEKMTEYITSGVWDSAVLGNANDQNYGTVGDRKGDGSYPTIEKAAASVSHYFSTPDGKCVQLRTSGYSKFSDQKIDPAVISGEKSVSITGILAMYQGKVQMVVNNIDDIKIY